MWSELTVRDRGEVFFLGRRAGVSVDNLPNTSGSSSISVDSAPTVQPGGSSGDVPLEVHDTQALHESD